MRWYLFLLIAFMTILVFGFVLVSWFAISFTLFHTQIHTLAAIQSLVVMFSSLGSFIFIEVVGSPSVCVCEPPKAMQHNTMNWIKIMIKEETSFLWLMTTSLTSATAAIGGIGVCMLTELLTVSCTAIDWAALLTHSFSQVLTAFVCLCPCLSMSEPCIHVALWVYVLVFISIFVVVVVSALFVCSLVFNALI